jgi:hypothetical protein
VPVDWLQPVTEAQELLVATGTPCERRGDKETTEAAVPSFFILSFDLVLREGVFAHAFFEDFPFLLPSSFLQLLSANIFFAFCFRFRRFR